MWLLPSTTSSVSVRIESMLSRRAITGGIASLLAAKPVIARRKYPQISGGGPSGGGGGYVAKAVHFDGLTYLETLNLSASATPIFSTSFWIKLTQAQINSGRQVIGGVNYPY